MQHISRPLIAFALLVPGAALADTATFSGEVEDTCTLDIQPGVLKPNTLHNTLSTATAGGENAQIIATTTSDDFTISITPPTEFTSKPGLYVSSTTFSSLMDISGATSAAATNSQNLNSGTNDVQLSLRADANMGIFPTGVYDAAVTVTCE